MTEWEQFERWIWIVFRASWRSRFLLIYETSTVLKICNAIDSRMSLLASLIAARLTHRIFAIG